ncbi:hypothetical protein LEMLEM_LOCUS7411 [Lemmus lemmus]
METCVIVLCTSPPVPGTVADKVSCRPRWSQPAI